MDVSDPGSVRAGLAGIDGSLDAVVMNAGGMGGKTPMKLTPDGATYMFAQNVLGHVVLLETLLAEDRLGEVAVFAGSEAARGIPKMGFKRPSFDSNSADELATVIDGSYFAGGKPDVNLAYGQAKLIGILWMAHLARQHPDRRFICVSPGNTTGTQAPNDLALPLRIAAKYVMPRLGIAHKLDVGAKRLVDGVTDPTLSSGVFYASAGKSSRVPWSTKQTSSPTSPTRRFRTTPTRPSTASYRSAPRLDSAAPTRGVPRQRARHRELVIELGADSDQRVCRRARTEPEHHRQLPCLRARVLAPAATVRPAADRRADANLSARGATHMHHQLASVQRLRDVDRWRRRSRYDRARPEPPELDGGTTTLVCAALPELPLPAALVSHTTMLQLPAPGTVTVAGPVAGVDSGALHDPEPPAGHTW